MMLLAHALEALDLLIVFAFGIGFFVPFRFRRIKLSHMILTWSVLAAQIAFGLQCPILICANDCRIAAGAECVATRFQPTFLAFLSQMTSPAIANGFMLANIFAGPFVATWLLVRNRVKNRR